MKYLVLIIIVLLALGIMAFFARRKHLETISQLEHEKHQIQNKPILEEMTKVKQLNMNGQTEEMFESWRNSWTEVMDVHMPKIDALLFDAEEYVDKFRFRKASHLETEMRELIQKADEQMNRILTELHELIGSEEKNREEMAIMEEEYRSGRKNLLAHYHSFGPAAEPLEKELEELNPLFDEYHTLTDSGNYLQARETVMKTKEKAERVFMLLKTIPQILVDLSQKIPSHIQELRYGQREMEEKDYYLQHLEIEKSLQSYEKELVELKENVSQLNTEHVHTRIEEMFEEIDTFYDLLENEVVAKQFVDSNKQPIEQTLIEETTAATRLNDEALYVQQSYRLLESEAEVPKNCLTQLAELQKRMEMVNQQTEEQKTAYSSLQEELQELQTSLLALQEERIAFEERLKNLRVDENEARTKFDELKRLLHETDRMVHKANIPGIPEDLNARLEEADEQLFLVIQSLQEVPLNMKLVNTYLEKADASIHDVHKRAEEMLENVKLIETIIQYGNRYRARYPEMNRKLVEAEDAFRQYRYSKALEDAATAVEEVEPGAMKRIEVLVKENGWHA